MDKPTFRRDAAEVCVVFAGHQLTLGAKPKEFRSGKLGWHLSGEGFFDVGDPPQQLRCRVSLTITAAGSDRWQDA